MYCDKSNHIVYCKTIDYIDFWSAQIWHIVKVAQVTLGLLEHCACRFLFWYVYQVQHHNLTKDVDEVVDSYNLEDDFRDFNADYPDPIEKSEQLMYWRKSFAYREIWGRYEREIFDDDNAIYFSLFGTYESSKLYRLLQCCLAEADAAMQSLGLCISNCQKIV